MFEVVNLKKTYKNNDGKYIGLNNISFKLGDSGVVFLFGKSGEGKSTLLNIMSGLDTYDAGGKVLFNGRDIMRMSQKERDYFRSHEIGIIFEKNNLLDDLTVEDNVKLARQIGGKEVTQAQVENALATVQLKGFAKRRISELSSGEVQRVAIARTLLLSPKVIFLDEPTGNLDKENAVIFWNAIKEISKKSLVIAISHRDEIVEQYADRVLTIQSGEIISDEYKSRKLKLQDKATFAEPVKARKKVERTGSLPFGTSTKIGSKALVANKFKFVAMLVLIALTLASFALSYLLANFNPNLVKTKTIAANGYKYVVFKKTDNSYVTTDDMAAVYKAGNETQYYYIYSAKENIKYTKAAGSFETTGYVEVSQELGSQVNTLGQKVLYGTYPKSNDGEIKIAISDYLARNLSKYGVEVAINSDDVVSPWINFEISDLVSTEEQTVKIALNGVFYTVAAIFETNYTDYVNSSLEVSEENKNDFAYNRDNIYSLIHIAPGKISDLILSKKSLEVQKLTFKADENREYTHTKTIINFDRLNDTSVTTFLTGSKESLTKYEIILPVDVFDEVFQVNFRDAFFDSGKTDEQRQQDFSSAINSKGDSFVVIATESGQEVQYTVVGLTNGKDVVFANNQPSQKNDEDKIKGCIGEMIKINNFPVLRIATKFTNENDFLTVLTNLTNNGFEYLSEYTAGINSATDFIAQLRVIFVTLTVFCLIFSIFCMVTFFADVIRARKRSIGALRSLGAKSSNVFLIFLMSCLILMVSSLALAGVVTLISDLVFNVQLMKTFGIGVTLFHMNWAAFGLMTAIGVAVAVLGSLIPISIYCTKTPIDVIKR